MLTSVAAVAAITSVMAGMAGVTSVPADAAPRDPTVAVGHVASASGSPRETTLSPLLRDLGSESVARIEDLVNRDSTSVAKLLVSPPSARATEAWWASNSAARQKALIDHAPRLVGNLDGIPFAARTRANTVELGRELSSTKSRLDGVVGKGVRSGLRQKLQTLEKIQGALKSKPGQPKRSLWILDDSTGSFRAAVVIGDLNTAHYISYLVPGMYMSVEDQLEAWATTAQEQYEAQRAWLKRTSSAGSGGRDDSVATIAWIGYDTPQLMNIAGLRLATAGAAYLEHSIAGLKADRATDPAYITVIAHSYGSTAALMALQSGSVSVDALALLGCPGSTAQSVADLSVRDGNVYVGQAAMDPIVHSAFFGSDPGAASYGAHPMGVAGGVDPIDHRRLTGSVGHNEYFAAGSESMRNLALIAIGKGQLVMKPGTPAQTDAAK